MSSISQFEACLDFTLGEEGGFSDDPADPGGATCMGITLATLSAWRGEACTADDVRALTRPEAAAIYREGYWAKANCDALPIGLDLTVFDEATNEGPQRSVMLLQETLGVAQDGIVGPQTLGAIAGRDVLRLVGGVAGAQRAWYLTRPGFARYGTGWLARLGRRQALAVLMAKGAGPASKESP